MANFKYITVGIILIAIAYFFLFTQMGNNIMMYGSTQMPPTTEIMENLQGTFLNTIGKSLLLYLIGLIGFITIIIGIMKD